MADTVDRSPLQSGPVVGTNLKEDIAEGYQKLGNVVQEPFAPGVTGAMVGEAAMARAQSITALANGISQGFSPLIDKMASGYKEQQAASGFSAGSNAGFAGSNVPGASQASTQSAPPSEPGAPASQLTRGADGTSSILPSLTSLFGIGGGSYSKAYGQGMVAASSIADQQAATEIRAKYPGDPEGFQGAWTAYVGGRNYGDSEYGQKAKLEALSIGSQHYGSLVTQKASQDVIASGKAIETQITSLSNDMSALARSGQMNSPVFDAKQDQLQDLYGQLGENPQYTGNPAEKLNENLSQFQSDNIIGKVDSAYQQGGASAAEKMVGDAVDQVQGLSDQERQQFLQEGRARIGYNQGINKDQIDVNRSTFSRLQQQGITAANSAELDGVINSAKQTGDYVTATEATRADGA